MTLTEKVAYLKGLVEGIGVDETTNQGKIMKAVLDVLDDMAFTVSDLEDSTSELYEELEAVDEDLSSLEDEIYGTEEDDECLRSKMPELRRGDLHRRLCTGQR